MDLGVEFSTILNLLWVLARVGILIFLIVIASKGARISRHQSWTLLMVALIVGLVSALISQVYWIAPYSGGYEVIGDYYLVISIVQTILGLIELVFLALGLYQLYKREVELRSGYNMPPPR